MKLQFVSYDNIDIIKSNLKSWVDNFKQDSSDWLQDELGNALFSDTKFAEIPDVCNLAASRMEIARSSSG